MNNVIDGQALAKQLLSDLPDKVDTFNLGKRCSLTLAVVLIGNDPPSLIYTSLKQKRCEEVGIQSQLYHLPDTTTMTEAFARIDQLNADPNVHGILMQLPLPAHLDAVALVSRISPLKDVDGLHPENLGLLMMGRPRLVPCTPQGCLQLIAQVQQDITGSNALVIGRSILVGKPMALLLTQQHATVTIAHSKTQNLEDLCLRADIIVAAMGKPRFIKGKWLNSRAIVIDVGINRLEDGSLAGDVDFDSAKTNVRAITPVPGGVGPLTIANLLLNTLKAGELQS